MTFTIQYLSDIHLEMHDSYNEGIITPSMFLKPKAPYLALCGDIGNPFLKAYDVFVRWCSNHYEKVFIVAGNHEYYNYRCQQKVDMVAKKTMIQTICEKYDNVFFLDCDTYYIPNQNLRVLGCTLWSDTSKGDQYDIATRMNDCRNIYSVGDHPISPPVIAELHTAQRDWLDKEISKAERNGEDVLILTHHLPSFLLIHDKYKGHSLNMCFASNCEDLIRSPVKAWICGHSHTGMRVEINGVLCLMNPHGYPGEKVETRNREAVVSFGTKELVVEI